MSSSNGGIITAGDGGAFVIGNANMSEADLEKLDGITDGTVAANKAIVVDSNKDASGFRHLSSSNGGNISAGHGGSFIIGSANMSEADLEKLDGITDGTVAANKAIVVDSNKDASGFRHLSASNGGNISAGHGGSFIIGNADMNEADLEKLDHHRWYCPANKAIVVTVTKTHLALDICLHLMAAILVLVMVVLLLLDPLT